MRRALTALSALFAAAPLVMAVPPPAAAATGTLVIEGEGVPRTQLDNPAAGCYSLPSFPFLSRAVIANNTNVEVVVYSGPDCKRGLLRAGVRIPAGTAKHRRMMGAHSVKVFPNSYVPHFEPFGKKTSAKDAPFWDTPPADAPSLPFPGDTPATRVPPAPPATAQVPSGDTATA
ncbi:hypothetical protein [Sphaerisporangium sp. TRM90804]|uniref:hypothetical protein n=1 Tax=Sphaerisporangium sp. TRM90804 TaxID=3031113 RepID=UPI00244731B2|nr:hypothetical protein [Sphaerisporangium sp. TRM90804]MDH2426330.1 hypothetical protein [Sphaerisporangium sp. TRM90804]